MSHYLLLYLISILYIGVEQVTADINYRKFVYQRDMSEYCRRRVMPAVFLGRQVVDANSQILHFSRLEVPYSCFITVRTEIGSNIIVVIQVVNDINLKKSCKQGDHQLVIYEMGETFGGYWGQLPDSVMRRERRRNDNVNILKSSTTAPTSPTTESTTTLSTSEVTTTPPKSSDEESEEDSNEEYLSMEIPILNISANIAFGQIELESSFTTKDSIDSVYDVTRRDGVSYETKVVPLLEIGVQQNKVTGRDGDKTDEGDSDVEFQMEINDIFTPDPRLMLLDVPDVTYKKKSYKYKPRVNRRLDFKKTKNLFIAKRPSKRPSSNLRPQLKTVQPNNYVSKLYDVKHDCTGAREEHKTESQTHYWDAIHAILKNLSKSSDVSTKPPHEELAKILQGISNKELNKSVYLGPALSYIDLHTPGVPITEHSSTTIGQPDGFRTHFNQLNDISTNMSASQDGNESNTGMNNNSAINNNNGATMALLPLAHDVDSIIVNVTNQHNKGVQDKQSNGVLDLNSTSNVKKPDSASVSLVDHESFDNVVQSASAMAIKLNQTGATSTFQTTQERYLTKKKRSNSRKKRYLHAVDIEGAKPHRVQERKYVTTTTAPEKFEMMDFQHLVELQDDEIHDRMAMRYLPQYLGPPLLDFCDFNETSTRYVYLFNSSRLVLAISNFTLKRMTVVVTPARTLLDSDARCGSTYLECQISGARVCIDSLCACDGVPNCGSYDIYDEDRLSCGAVGSHHNVCLAAITFLAVLLTFLYTVHYWLKRCVPKVSEAFFIYTDTAENVLYLDSIMKSPHDMGVGKDFLCGVPELFAYGEKSKEKNACKEFIERCLVFLRCKKTPEDEVVTADFDQLYSKKISAFAEMEIKKMTSSIAYSSDAAVQTCSSAEEEMFSFSSIYSRDENFISDNLVGTSMERTQSRPVDADSNQPSDELSMLQFLRKVRARSVSLQQSTMNNDFANLSYKSQESSVKHTSNNQGTRSEIQEMDQYRTDKKKIIEKPQVSKKSSIMDKADIKSSAVKHLRFQDEKFVISHKDEKDDAVSTLTNKRRSIVLGSNKVFRIQERDDEIRETEEQSAGTGREIKSYFNWGKEKNKKKPKKK